MGEIKSAVFLDRDGVLCEYKEEIIELKDFILRGKVGPAIAKLNQANYLVFVVTNQPQVAKGKLSIPQLNAQHYKLNEHLKSCNAHLDKIYYCPHRANGQIKEFAFDCDCRKPKPGLLFQAVKEFEIDLAKSILIGDTWRDSECAYNAGIKCYGVEGGGGYPYEKDSVGYSKIKPEKIFSDLNQAVDFIINNGVGN